MYEPNAVFWVVQSFQNRKNVDWWRSPKWTNFHVNRRRSHRCISWFDSLKSPFDCQRDCWSHVAVPKRLREAVRRKKPQFWMNQSWVLHHDNAPANSSFLVRNFLATKETTVIPQPPYSPDFFCFLSWSLPWKDAVSTHLTRSRKIRRRSCSPFRKKRYRKGSKVGRNVGSDVLLAKETTLKAKNLNKLYLST